MSRVMRLGQVMLIDSSASRLIQQVTQAESSRYKFSYRARVESLKL